MYKGLIFNVFNEGKRNWKYERGKLYIEVIDMPNGCTPPPPPKGGILSGAFVFSFVPPKAFGVVQKITAFAEMQNLD